MSYGLSRIPTPRSVAPEDILAYLRDHTDYAVILAIICLQTTLILWLFIQIVFLHYYKRNREKEESKIRTQAENVFSSYVSGIMPHSEALLELQHLAPHKKGHVEIIQNLFLEFFRLIHGQGFDNLKLFFQESGMEKQLIHDLKNSPDDLSMLYIQLASESKCEGAKQELKFLLRHKNRDIRFQALCALVEVFHFDALTYIEESGFHLNEWEEMILLEKFLLLPNRHQFPLERFLSSDNEELVRMTIRIGRFFNRYDIAPALKQLIHHSNQLIRKRVYLAIGTLLLSEHEQDLIHQYPNEESANKKIILQTLGLTGTEDSLDFLLQIAGSQIPELSLEAARAVQKIGKKERLKAGSAENEHLQRIIAHLEDPLL